MKFIIFFSLFSLSFSALSCRIETYERIVKINKVLDDHIIKSSDCNSEVNEAFINLISSANGQTRSAHLARVLSSEQTNDVSISPEQIKISRLEEELANKFSENRFEFSGISALYSFSALTLNEIDALDFECKNCDSSGRKNIKATIGDKSIWLSASLLYRLQALKLKKNLSYHTPILTKEDFELVEILDKDAGRYFTDLKNIHFYQLNRNIATGDVLKVNDIRPKNLISFGQKVQLHVINSEVNLKTIGIAKKSGKFGDFIEIENPKSKKIIMGKVTGHNTAVVEL
ncbi:MAG: flagellar basal body P-ring formation chaperone FlgA [Bdellovibrionota bacterium]|nr:flagellar basal body P-ring formation chaperone FlgA [Bdellovibrionota bacterium]